MSEWRNKYIEVLKQLSEKLKTMSDNQIVELFGSDDVGDLPVIYADLERMVMHEETKTLGGVR